MLIDLQLHSTYSDGYLSPTELVEFMNKQGVKVASLTDHNTVSGLEEFKASCKQKNIQFIPGIELYVKYKSKRFNILWYNFDCSNPDLHKLLRDTQRRRRARVRNLLRKLVELEGFKLDIDKIVDSYNHYVPINHIVGDLIRNPSNRKIVSDKLEDENFREGDVIKEFFKNKKYGILHESYISVERIVKIRKNVGGQLILNHPGKYGHIKKEFFINLKNLGFDGVEILSPHHNLGAIMYIQHLVDEMSWLVTGGSDFHRNEAKGERIRNSWNYFEIDSKYLKGVEKIIK